MSQTFSDYIYPLDIGPVQLSEERTVPTTVNMHGLDIPHMSSTVLPANPWVEREIMRGNKVS